MTYDEPMTPPRDLERELAEAHAEIERMRNQTITDLACLLYERMEDLSELPAAEVDHIDWKSAWRLAEMEAYEGYHASAFMEALYVIAGSPHDE